IIAIGFFTYSDLRDAISRNNLKLPDLHDARELVRGDPLLKLDQLLGTALDGVYRPSEIYLRLMQKLTAPNFGTRVGRWITRYITLPFGAALLALEGIDLIFRESYKYIDSGAYNPVFGPLSVLLGYWSPSYPQSSSPSVAPALLGLLGVFLLCVFNSATFRQELGTVVSQAYWGFRWIFFDLPTRLVPWPALRAILKSGPFQLFYSVCFLPLLVCGLLWWFFQEAFDNRWRAAGIFLALEVLFNSRPGQAAGEAATRGSLRVFDWFRSGLIPGLFRFIVRLFKQITDGVEYVLYSV